MCLLFRKKKREKLKIGALNYIRNTYVPFVPSVKEESTESKIQYSRRNSSEARYSDRDTTEIRYSDRDSSGIKYSERTNSEIKYSLRDIPEEISLKDNYDEKVVSRAMESRNKGADATRLSGLLSRTTSQSFVECMVTYIRRKGLRDSEVYKAAQIDRRLYSKMISDYQYKPGKDTAVAICYALKLSLAETNDILNRAGYSLSHSTKRDIIIEYFFKEQEYDIMEINTVLFELGEKPLGR